MTYLLVKTIDLYSEELTEDMWQLSLQAIEIRIKSGDKWNTGGKLLWKTITKKSGI